MNLDGTGFTRLHSFAATSGALNANSDGANPSAGLILSGNTLYGTASSGGIAGNGTLCALNNDGTRFTTLHTFTASSGPLNANNDGADPHATLVLSGGTLYGTAVAGGNSWFGTVFSLSLPTAPPQLTLTPSGLNVILTWLTNATGFILQSITDLGSSAVWTTNTPVPVIVNDQNVVTNPISGTRQFYRLAQ